MSSAPRRPGRAGRVRARRAAPSRSSQGPSRCPSPGSPNGGDLVLAPAWLTPPAAPVQLSYDELLTLWKNAGESYARPLERARRDQQDRVELRAEHGPELGRGDRLDAVHAVDLDPLGNRRRRRRHRRSVEPGRRDLLGGPVPRRVRRRGRPPTGGLLLQPRRLVRERRPVSWRSSTAALDTGGSADASRTLGRPARVRARQAPVPAGWCAGRGDEGERGIPSRVRPGCSARRPRARRRRARRIAAASLRPAGRRRSGPRRLASSRMPRRRRRSACGERSARPGLRSPV